MRRYPSSPYSMTAAFGPGPLTPAVKVLLIANVAMFLVTLAVPRLFYVLGLRPADVVEHFEWWQPVTYAFLHDGITHLLFNMLALWMFGVELERLWGTPFFARYYAITGIGAGLVTVALGLLPFEFTRYIYGNITVGASGALFGILVAYALYFPHRQVLAFFLFPVPVRVFVLIVGAATLFASGVAHWAHIAGAAIGFVYLKTGTFGVHPIAELKYRYLKWKINRLRRKFDVYSGGRADDVNRRIH